MDPSRISELLHPFLADSGTGDSLSSVQFDSISTYIDLLIRWNARINLTAIRDPEEIVTRHFGESLFAARHLFPANAPHPTANDRLLDLGSGAGFPGIPIKIWAPTIHMTLVESQQKKATFLREVCRTLTLTNIDVVSSRAEQMPPATAHIVTMRAVERFDSVLPVAIRLLASGGCLALLISREQITPAKKHAPALHWLPEIHLPLSNDRILLIGQREQMKPTESIK